MIIDSQVIRRIPASSINVSNMYSVNSQINLLIAIEQHLSVQIVGSGSQRILSESMRPCHRQEEGRIWHTYLLMRLPSPLVRAYAHIPSL